MEKNNKNSNQESFSKVSINWYPGHMAKTRREIKEKLALIDIVYEILDARMPISSKIIDLDEVIGNKKRILVITKYDMCDKKETDKILEYYRSLGNIVINVDLIKGTNISIVLNETNKIAEIVNKERASKGLKPRNIRALVVGVPNVGKSTFINRMVGKKVAITGDRPGITKNLTWLRVGKNIELLDSPGILWPKIENQTHAYNLAALSSIKEEIIDLQSLSIYILQTLIKYYPELLKNRYKFEKIDDDITILIEKIGKLRGCISKGGKIDYDKVYKTIIRDLKDGLIGNITFDRL
ncbi:MAG: ribosome biogenesis GTPase YlqF [bacterium]|nr:ribosome biogenesis GTPase YlqF [bacterium]